MPGTVDDFIQHFGSSQTMDESTAAHYVDRFASSDPKDAEFDSHTMANGATEYLGKLPEPQFQQAAQNAYASASPDQQQSLMGTLMNALQGRGINLSSILGQNANPSSINPAQYAQVANYARQQQPDVLKQVVQQQPWFMKAMGHPVMMGALAMVASHMLKSRANTQAQPAQPPQSGGVGALLGKLF